MCQIAPLLLSSIALTALSLSWPTHAWSQTADIPVKGPNDAAPQTTASAIARQIGL